MNTASSPDPRFAITDQEWSNELRWQRAHEHEMFLNDKARMYRDKAERSAADLQEARLVVEKLERERMRLLVIVGGLLVLVALLGGFRLLLLFWYSAGGGSR